MGAGGFGIFGAILSLLFFLLIVVGIIIFIYWIIKQFTPGITSQIPSTNRALEILKERYAKGEITKEEFEEMRKEIGL